MAACGFSHTNKRPHCVSHPSTKNSQACVHDAIRNTLPVRTSMALSIRCFFNDTATTEIYTLSLHDALPICSFADSRPPESSKTLQGRLRLPARSEEHTSELQSLAYLVCRLLLEKNHTT